MIHVQTHSACLDDEPGLSRLLSCVPFPSSVRSLLLRRYFGRRWQQQETCDYWLASDGAIVSCWRICNATAAQVLAIRLRFDELADRDADLEISRELICTLVSGVTGECQCAPEQPLVLRPLRRGT